jgi:hypothetical protein
MDSDLQVSILLDLFKDFCLTETRDRQVSTLPTSTKPPNTFIFPPPLVTHPFQLGDCLTPYSPRLPTWHQMRQAPTDMCGVPFRTHAHPAWPGVVDLQAAGDVTMHPMEGTYYPMPKGKGKGQSIIWLFRKHSNPDQSFIRTHSRADTRQMALQPVFTLQGLQRP